MTPRTQSWKRGTGRRRGGGDGRAAQNLRQGLRSAGRRLGEWLRGRAPGSYDAGLTEGGVMPKSVAQPRPASKVVRGRYSQPTQPE